MQDPFFSKKHCDRCGAELTVRTMSMFNEEGTAAFRLPQGGRGGQRRHPARRPELQGHRTEKQVNGKETTMPKTNIKVRIIGVDGNVFCLLGICRRALGRAGKIELWNEFYKEATSGDYNHALATIADWFVVCSVDESEDED